MKHWKFTGEKMQVLGAELKRIRATDNFAVASGIVTKTGENGGWIEKEENLSDNAWVSGNAWVSCDAHYFQIGPAGSRNDYTTFMRDKNGVIYVSCGCFFGSITEFREKVRKTHGDNKHAKIYLTAADLAELQIDTMPIEKGEIDILLEDIEKEEENA